MMEKKSAFEEREEGEKEGGGKEEEEEEEEREEERGRTVTTPTTTTTLTQENDSSTQRDFGSETIADNNNNIETQQTTASSIASSTSSTQNIDSGDRKEGEESEGEHEGREEEGELGNDESIAMPATFPYSSLHFWKINKDDVAKEDNNEQRAMTLVQRRSAGSSTVEEASGELEEAMEDGLEPNDEEDDTYSHWEVDVPREIWVHIFGYLSLSDLVSVMCTCKRMKSTYSTILS